MLATDLRKRFRKCLSEQSCLQPASVFDPISARIADMLGFKIGMLGGSVASAVILGAPDLALITLTELAGLVRRITRASNLSLMVDADHGYGNALNVMRTVRELEASGASALTIEDTDLPARFGTPHTKKLIPIPEMIGKLRSAVQARDDPSTVIIGRTDAFPIEGPVQTTERIQAYSNAGIDAIFLVGISTRRELEGIRAATNLPLILGATTPDLDDSDYLASIGVRIMVKGHESFRAAVEAVYNSFYCQLGGKKTSALFDTTDPATSLAKLLNQHAYDELKKEFLGESG